MPKSNRLKTGTLVKIAIREKRCTDDGFTTLSSYAQKYDHDTGIVYEYVDLNSFPSCNDFKGKTTKVRHNQLATILSYVGRPYQIRDSDHFEAYDIYEVLIDGAIRQVFKRNLVLANQLFESTMLAGLQDDDI